MIIEAKNLGKRFARDWVIKDFNQKFEGPNIYAITGPNGSGKSTLLKMLAQFSIPTKGTCDWVNESSIVTEEERYKLMSVAAPYMELVEDLTLNEFLDFHNQFRKFDQDYDKSHFLNETRLEKSKNKLIKDFSSGMKQRIKLGLCFYCKSEVVFIDEGTTNLDRQGIEWYFESLKKLGKLVILFSNQEDEYNLASEVIAIN
jgi:ABC-type multidrug transport system ATPase subunit